MNLLKFFLEQWQLKIILKMILMTYDIQIHPYRHIFLLQRLREGKSKDSLDESVFLRNSHKVILFISFICNDDSLGVVAKTGDFRCRPQQSVCIEIIQWSLKLKLKLSETVN